MDGEERIVVFGKRGKSNAHPHHGLSFIVIIFHVASAETLTLSAARL
jgi:hypothetical protein